tara:strand:- start:413 stop:658 length:246 start_codon:yes stop_codon:yes gene_type:complete
MCLFTKVVTTAGAPAVKPRQDQDTGLPEGRDTREPDEVASVEYGSSPKRADTASANRLGTDALQINLNKNDAGSSTGGINV